MGREPGFALQADSLIGSSPISSTNDSNRGCSSLGRAPALQAGGSRFEPDHLQKFFVY